MTRSGQPVPGAREVVDRVRELALNYDADGQADLYAEDGVIEFPFAPPGMPGRVQGREEIRGMWRSSAQAARRTGRRLTEHRLVVVHETADPEVVVVEFEAHGELASGDTYQLPLVQVFRVRKGEIVCLRDYFSVEVFAMAFGNEGLP